MHYAPILYGTKWNILISLTSLLPRPGASFQVAGFQTDFPLRPVTQVTQSINMSWVPPEPLPLRCARFEDGQNWSLGGQSPRETHRPGPELPDMDYRSCCNMTLSRDLAFPWKPPSQATRPWPQGACGWAGETSYWSMAWPKLSWMLKKGSLFTEWKDRDGLEWGVAEGF